MKKNDKLTSEKQKRSKKMPQAAGQLGGGLSKKEKEKRNISLKVIAWLPSFYKILIHG